jgi:hypothetical protein
MSRSSASSVSMKKNKVMPACKHCENLKLPSAHWLRSLEGTIACPVLLATECRYCHITGHTVKSCPELASKNKPLSKPVFAPVHREKKVTRDNAANRDFRVLQEADTDSDEESGRVFPEEKVVAWNGKPSFANVLRTTPRSTPCSIVPMQEDEEVVYPSSPLSPPPFQPYLSHIASTYAGKSWADMSDSDDEF